MESLKLPENILLEIQDLQTRISKSLLEVGQITLIISKMESEIKVAEQEKNKKVLEAENLEDEQRRLSDRIVSEYGEGKLDLSSGIYTRE
jgi:hypothetical protein